MKANLYPGRTLPALVFGAALLAGCGGGESSNQAADSAPVIEETQIPVEPAVELEQQVVVAGAVGGYKDQGLDAARKVSDISLNPEDAVVVAEARSEARQIAHPGIAARTLEAIDQRVADNVRYAGQDYYHYPTASLEVTVASAQADEAIVELIENADIKAIAEQQLDYVQADAAIEAGHQDYSTEVTRPDIAGRLLELVEDPAISHLATNAMAGNEAAKTEFTRALSTNQSDFSARIGSAYLSLYYGSNSHATSINRDIENFNAAQVADGQ